MRPQAFGVSCGQRPSVPCTVVRVWEVAPPASANRLEWLLLTDLPAESFAQACEIAQMYATRWLEEEFHKALKTGVGVERLQLTTAHEWFAATAVRSIVAVRLLELRERMGTEAFFAQLNKGVGGGGAGGGWGEFDSGWDAASFEAAMLEPPNGEERSRLVGDLITQYFSAYRSLAGSGESFVSLDDGLSIMSRHAQALGYDAVILFLDELVLWLASHAADVNFVSREGTKLVKLVEATNAERPVPLISFVARQRDLRDLVGENLAGSVQLQFSDVLKHWEARFHRITLEDRNLPAIAEKRVLRPVDEAARQTLQTTFDDVMKMRKDVLDTLLTTTADREMFRKVHPFSPALVQTLIAVSAAHRYDGVFEAARYGIDRLKEIVPVWKKEVGPLGEEWIEGHYYPTRADVEDAPVYEP